METPTRETRDRGHPVKVYVSDREHEEIEARAASAGLSASAFLRALGLNEPIRSTADHDAVRELMRINGDLGRLGGLLKLWLSERAGHGAKIADVRQVLHDIEALRQEMLHVASRVRRP
jgi:hypothetical protein